MAVFGVLLADEDGVYDPSDPNDRLLLGLKGMISEFEIMTMRSRLERGKLHKAERGELFVGAPLGYVRLPSRGLDLDPDEQVRGGVRMIFDRFNQLGSVGAVFRCLRGEGFSLAVRVTKGPNRGQVEQRPPRLGGSTTCSAIRCTRGPIPMGGDPSIPNDRRRGVRRAGSGRSRERMEGANSRSRPSLYHLGGLSGGGWGVIENARHQAPCRQPDRVKPTPTESRSCLGTTEHWSGDQRSNV